MTRRLSVVAVAFVAALLSIRVTATGPRQTRDRGAVQAPVAAPRLESRLLAGLQWRNIGPAVLGGRTVDFAVTSDNADIIYAATATGGVWKTTNRGATWDPVFEREGTASVGAVAVAPTNPNIVWVGTGEAWNARSESWGDGIYKSENGGKSWKRMGLEASQHIGRILVHPADPNIVYVAALGALWGGNEERGLFKTVDGGKTWSKTLYVSPHTGVADVAMDPRDPNVLYAAAFQRERRNYSFVGGGPESALYKTTDAGGHWEKVGNGLPAGEVGRIGVSVCLSAPDTVYAAIDAKGQERGIYRSEDRGASWQHRNTEISTSWGSGQIRCDPANPDRIYVLRNGEAISDDGGKTFERALAVPGVHVDLHALWIDPANSTHLILGTDGGVYMSADRGVSWDFVSQMPVAQFYTVAVDMQEPFYYVYGGTQDNNSVGGPSGTRNTDGIVNADWFVTVPGDGFHAQIDPADPTTVYTESQYGRLVRFDTRTGERRLIQPRQPEASEGPKLRWNWSSPVIISHFDHRTVYFAANRLFKTQNRGDTWKAISPDLTRQLDLYALPLMGKVWPRDAIALHAGTADYGQISTLSESPLRAGVLAVGTDDGVIQLTQDDGSTWTKIDRFPEVPERTYVSRVVLSRFAERTLYATFDGHQDNSFLPYVLKSVDFGKTWTSIAGDLPKSATVRAIVEYPRNPNVLFVGTETGVFVSIAGGGRWVPLGNNLPTVPVHDIVVHPRENDLVLGTHGRGFWILDDISIFDGLTPEALGSAAYLAPVRPALQLHRFDRGRRFLGHRNFAASNPPDGAIITYYVKPPPATPVPSGSSEMPAGDGVANEIRPADGAVSGGRESQAEAASKAPGVRVQVLDAQGRLVRDLEIPQGERATGIHRVVWDLRHPLAFTPARSEQVSFFGGRLKGPFVLPGEYRVRLTVGSAEQTQTVTVKSDPLVTISPESRRAWHDTLTRVNQLQATVRSVLATASQLESHVKSAREAIARHGSAAPALSDDAGRIAAQIAALFGDIRGGAARSAAEQEGPLPLGSQLDQLFANIEASTAEPTDDQRWLIQHCEERLADVVARVNRLLTEAVPAFDKALDQNGVPWTSGRSIAMPPVPKPGSGPPGRR